jgi:AraC-like DNA-binding protein
MLRSAFSAKFTELVGQPPLQYLIQWRMQLARAHLQNTLEPLSVVASRFGYQSEAAFCRMFKRIFGMTPGSIRGRSAVAPMDTLRPISWFCICERNVCQRTDGADCIAHPQIIAIHEE